MSNKFIIKKEDFDLLYSDFITKKEYNIIVKKIDIRFEEICNKFLTKQTKTANFHYRERSGYEFDPKECRDFIAIEGEFISLPNGYDFKIPTRWLWEEGWLEEIKETEMAAFKHDEEKAIKREELRREILALQESAKAKLTPEEIKVIYFPPVT